MDAKMTSKQIAKQMIANKIAIKELEDQIKNGLVELRNRGVVDITTTNGMIYTVSESTRKELDKKGLSEYLGEKYKEFERECVVQEHYVIKPSK